MQPTRTANIHDIPGLAVLDAKVWCCCAYDLEGCGRVQVDDGVPLLVRHLVDHAVPRVAGVVDDDVDLAVAEGGGFFDECGYVGVVEDVADARDGGAAGFIDLVDDVLGFFWEGSVLCSCES
jgi:hypothetical protein